MKIKNFYRKKKTLIIAEIGINHNGNFELCMKMIKEAKKCGADAIKLQSINSNNSYMEDTKSFKIFKNTNFDINQLSIIKKFCQKNNLVFFTTPGDIESLNSLKNLNLQIYKISSGLFTNLPLINEVLKLKKPIIFSTGMAKISEINTVYNLAKRFLGNNFALLKCTASYPCIDKDINLNGIKTLLNNYNCEIGYSDHSLDSLAPVAAVAMGASIIEKHFTIDKNLKGGDNFMSTLPNEFKKMVLDIRRVENISGTFELKPTKNELIERKFRYRYLVSSTNISKGKKINIQNVNMKRLSKHHSSYIQAINFDKYKTKKLKKDVPVNTILNKNLF